MLITKCPTARCTAAPARARARAITTICGSQRPSSRREQVIQADRKFGDAWDHAILRGTIPQSISHDVHAHGAPADATAAGALPADASKALQLHHAVEAASTPDELMQIIMQPSFRVALPVTVCSALLRLAAWLSSRGSAAAADPGAAATATDVLQQLLVARASQCSLHQMANALWSLATLQEGMQASAVATPAAAAAAPATAAAAAEDASAGGAAAAEAAAGSQAQGSCSQRTSAQVRQAVASWARHHSTPGFAAQATTHDLITMVWGLGALGACCSSGGGGGSSQAAAAAPALRQAQQQQQLQREELQVLRHAVDAMCGELASRLRACREDDMFQAEDLSDLSAALAAMCPSHKSGDMSRLIEAIAHEVYRQVSNRHSMHAPFTPPDLLKTLRAFADMQHQHAGIPRMLDAIATHVVKRLRAKHVNAVTKPQDVDALLQAYADAGHRTVVVPELVSATAHQLILGVATHNEWVHTNVQRVTEGSGSSSSGDSDDGSSSFDGDPDELAESVRRNGWVIHMPACTAASLLRSYCLLGYYPGRLLVSSLLLTVLPQLRYTPPATVASIVCRLADMGHRPADQVLRMLMAPLQGELLQQQQQQQQQEHLSPRALEDLLLACARLGYGCQQQPGLDAGTV